MDDRSITLPDLSEWKSMLRIELRTSSPSVVLSVMCAAVTDAGLKASPSTNESGAILVEAVRPNRLCLRQELLHVGEVRATARPRGDSHILEISLAHGALARVVRIAMLCVLPMFWFVALAGYHSYSSQLVLVGILGAVVTATTVFFFLATRPEMLHDCGRLTDSIKAECRVRNISLAPVFTQQPAVQETRTLVFVAMTALFVSVAALLIGGRPRIDIEPLPMTVSFGLLIFMACVLVFFLFKYSNHPQSRRVTPFIVSLLPGILLCVVLFAPIFLIRHADSWSRPVPVEPFDRVQTGRDYEFRVPQGGSSRPREDLVLAVVPPPGSMIREEIAKLLLAPLVASLALIVFIVEFVPRTVADLASFKEDVDVMDVDSFINGGETLRSARKYVIIMWVLQLSSVVTLLLYYLWVGVQAVVDPTGVPVVSAVARLVEYEFNLVVGGGDSMQLASILVLSAVVFAWTIPLSLGVAYFIRRTLALARLTMSHRRTRSNPAAAYGIDALETIANRIGIPAPKFVLVRSDGISASAHSFWGGRWRFIVCTSGLTESLDRREIPAVLAHECGHHALRHCERHNLLSMLGRLTLIGAAAAVVLEDSFGYELAADAYATTECGIDVTVFQSSLMSLAAIASRPQLDDNLTECAVPLQWSSNRWSRRRQGQTYLRWVVECWKMWRQLYLSDHVTYWHPSPRERLVALQQRGHDQNS